MNNRNSLIINAPQSGGKTLKKKTSPNRILVVDSNSDLLMLYTDALAGPEIQIDVAEDSAAAWEALRTHDYDLLFTENDVPDSIGDELVTKLRAARMAVPVVIAAGKLSMPEFSRYHPCPFVATLLKPFDLVALQNTIKRAMHGVALFMLLQICWPNFAAAQSGKAELDVNVPRTAVTLSTHGKCEYSEDGVKFLELEYGQSLGEGAVIRTGEDALADLFFRRTGVAVRLQAGTEIRLEKMTVALKDGLPTVHTLLDLRKGRIFTVVRSEVAGSTLEIRNAAGRSVVEGSGVGRYIITADGTHVTAKGSAIPLKVIGENGITIIAAGQQFARKDGKMQSMRSNRWVNELIQLDQLQAIVETPADKSSPKQGTTSRD